MAGDRIVVSTEGFAQVSQALRSMPPTTRRVVNVEMRKAATIVRDEGARIAPRGNDPHSGQLADTLQIRTRSIGALPVVKVGSNQPYAGPRMFARRIGGRFGPRRNVPDPFLIRALGHKAPEFAAALTAGLQRAYDALFGA